MDLRQTQPKQTTQTPLKRSFHLFLSSIVSQRLLLTLLLTGLTCIITSPWALAGLQPSPTDVSGVPTLQTVLVGNQRLPQNRARDSYRHPLETLEFFGLRPTMTVVELWPGNGWYTEILAPFLAAKGHLIVTNLNPQTNKPAQLFRDKLAANPTVFGKVQVVQIDPPLQLTLAPDNSVDMVLTFRNIHNWVSAGYVEKVYAAAYRALKPGGILGIEEHRAKPGISSQESAKTGYMAEADVIAALKKVGFKLVSQSEINANPRDTKDYPGGVWSLPPTLRQGNVDRERYLAIGESDRMTLKFVKPLSR